MVLKFSELYLNNCDKCDIVAIELYVERLVM